MFFELYNAKNTLFLSKIAFINTNFLPKSTVTLEILLQKLQQLFLRTTSVKNLLKKSNLTLKHPFLAKNQM